MLNPELLHAWLCEVVNLPFLLGSEGPEMFQVSLITKEKLHSREAVKNDVGLQLF